MGTLLKNTDPFAKNPKSMIDLVGLIALGLEKQRQDIELVEGLLEALKANLSPSVQPTVDDQPPPAVRTHLPEVENIDLLEIWDLLVTEEIFMEGSEVWSLVKGSNQGGMSFQ